LVKANVMEACCRKCNAVVDCLGNPCPKCGQAQRIPIMFGDGSFLFLPEGMSRPDLESLFAEWVLD
jgi:hypothetical protein